MSARKEVAPPIHDQWSDIVEQQAKHVLKHDGKPGSWRLAKSSFVVDKHGKRYRMKLLMSQGDTVIAWVLLDGSDIVGFGTLTPPEPAKISMSRIRPDRQRLGLYLSVLKSLRKMVGPLRSDRTMTAGAVATWERAGGKYVRRVLGGEDFYTLNPSGDLSGVMLLGGVVALAVVLGRRS